MKTKIGIISDTHGLLRPQVLEILKTCDCILHGGDVNKPEILDQLRWLGNLYVVRGNNDKEWAEGLSENLRFTIGGVNFFMVHNKKNMARNLDGVDVVVFGHSHKYFEKEVDGRLWLNPGSCGRRRFDQEITMAVMTVEDGSFEVEKIVIPG
ncbi:MAG: metallophosphoesterase family protein [Blautia sp.]|nr:metallophosphoesterase family protein [Blautia sp.]